MSGSAPGHPAGWYPDPGGRGQRYWDGSAWGPMAPAAGPPQQAPQQAPKRRRGRGCLLSILGAVIVLVVIIVIIAVAASSSSKPGSGTSSHPAAGDITVTSCAVDSIGVPTAKGTILNHSSGASNYTFTVSFLNPAGTVVAQGAGIENHIAAHQTATWSASGDQQASGALTCKVVDVTRFAAP